MPRVSLTSKQLSNQLGKQLLHLLCTVTQDGELSLGEIEQLRSMLKATEADIDVPAIPWLRELIEACLADGKVTREERLELLMAFERVLPMEERILAKSRRRNASAHDEAAPEARSSRWEDDPASDRQIAYLGALGIDVEEGLTKGRASELITACVDQGSTTVSNRQMMVLRFWDRVDIAKGGRGAVSDWMDSWYAQDPRHLDAWTKWKIDNGDQGKQDDPAKVPIGAGYQILAKMAPAPKAAADETDRAKPRSGSLSETLITWAVLAFVAWMIFRYVAS
jgi:hypothetical protein